jgi:TRAP-type C4-dicarboxylate transport system permease small subunit
MKILKWLDESFEETIMTICLIMITLVMGYSVIMRYIFNDALSWAEEICRYLFVYSALLSVPLCLRRRSSVKIDIIMLKLPPLLQKLLLLAGDAFMLAFFGYMLNASFGVVGVVYRSGQTSPALLIPMYFIFASAVIGFALAMMRIVQRMYFLITTPGADYKAHLEAGRRKT